MRQILVALSPNIGIPEEYLLSQFEHLGTLEEYPGQQQLRGSAAAGVSSADTALLQLEFDHECL